ncbi:MAG: FxsA family protein [Gammaproteobacteria bacterium]|nr:FxsA family protein [Gammaproteobacteria bacterium]
MFKLLLLIFILIPAFEIYLLITVGGVIGAIPTILLVIGTAVVGVQLLRQQGLSTLARLQSSVQQGELPTTVMLEGVILLLCGALLLTPGFFTDAIGFLMLVPHLRRWVIERLIRRVVFATATNFGDSPRTHQPPHGESQSQRTIEGEFHRED